MGEIQQDRLKVGSRLIGHVFQDLAEGADSQRLVGRDSEVLLLIAVLPAEAHVAAALSCDDITVGRQPPGQVRTVEVAGDFHSASSSWRT